MCVYPVIYGNSDRMRNPACPQDQADTVTWYSVAHRPPVGAGREDNVLTVSTDCEPGGTQLTEQNGLRLELKQFTA